MKAVQFDQYGEPDVLHVAEADEPHAGAGRIRVAVRAVGVNPFDWKVRSGVVQQSFQVEFPYIPGLEASGVVDEVGDGVTGVSMSDEVFGNSSRATAQYAVLDHFAAKPAAMSWAEAAALLVAAETAARALGLLGVKAGQTVLINGAAGGVGTLATQFAVADGTSVIGTASEANQDYLRSLGATPIPYGPGLVSRVREIAPNGVDLALDIAGRGALPDLIEITGSPDNVITIADYTAAQHGVRFTGGGEGERRFDALGTAATLYEQGKLSVPIAETFPLEQAARAHRISQDGHVQGKLVILVE